jgi:hypothetical protein
VSLAEETEAGAAEYRDRLLDLVGQEAGDTGRAFAAAYVRRLSADGISAEHLAAEVLGRDALGGQPPYVGRRKGARRVPAARLRDVQQPVSVLT